jgi:hypothetical protein
MVATSTSSTNIPSFIGSPRSIVSDIQQRFSATNSASSSSSSSSSSSQLIWIDAVMDTSLRHDTFPLEDKSKPPLPPIPPPPRSPPPPSSSSSSPSSLHNISAPPPTASFQSLVDLDTFLHDVYQSLPQHAVIVAITQPPLIHLNRMNEEKTRLRWEQVCVVHVYICLYMFTHL